MILLSTKTWFKIQVGNLDKMFNQFSKRKKNIMKIKQLITPSFFKMFLVGLILTAAIFSCKKEYSPVLKNAAQVAEFAPISGSWTNSYYVTSTNAPYLIPVGFTDFSNTDRTINFTVTSRTAVAGQQYTAPAPITIKAGQVLDTLRFSGLFSGYSGGRIDTVVIKFTGYSAVNGLDSMVLILRPYCDVIGTALTGNYTNTSDYQSPYGTSASNYTAVISSWTPLTATTATVVIQNIGLSPDIGFGGNPNASGSDPIYTGITATADWTDPSNFKITIPQQTYANNEYGYGVAKITGTSGSFSSCDQRFTLTYTITVSAGSFGSFTTTLVR